MPIGIKRIYDSPAPEDGIRVLVDRLWPRGVRKSEASIDVWLKDIAPTRALRRWFAHSPEKWEEFQVRYHSELEQLDDLVAQLIEMSRNEKITLLYGARNRECNHAVALRAYLGFLAQTVKNLH